MLRKEDIIIISSIDWDFIWQGHQEIASRLSEQGNRVLFIENTGVRSPGLKDFNRLSKRLKNWFNSIKGFKKLNNHLYLYSPVVLPFPYSKIALFINHIIIHSSIHRWQKRLRFNNPIILTFLPTRLANKLTESIDKKAFVYYCIDSFENSSPKAGKILKSESETFKKADAVFVTAHKLKEKAAKFNKNVNIVPFGVSLNNFKINPKEPEDMKPIPRPIAGYVGGLHQWVDFNLLRQVIQDLPGISFVFVGPEQTDVSQISGFPNVFLLGKKDHKQLSHYISSFDCCLIPYKKTDYTENVYPTKLNEYLYWRKPVASTDLIEVKMFSKEHPGHIHISHNTDEFRDHVEKSCKEKASPEILKQRKRVAEENSWENKINFMCKEIDRVIQKKQDEMEKNWARYFSKNMDKLKKLTIRSAFLIILLLFLIFKTNIMWFVASPLTYDDKIEKADAIVVFAGGVGESGKPGQGYAERVNHAVLLYEKKLADKLIFSSGFAYVIKEPQSMKALAVSLGVPESHVILEDKAHSTYDNIRFTKNILDTNQWNKIIIVTSPYHMRRVQLTMDKIAPGIEYTISPPPDNIFYEHESGFFHGITLSQLKGIIHEYMAIIYYWHKGRV